MTQTLRAAANQGNPNKVGDVNQVGRMGDVLQISARTHVSSVTTNVLPLGETAKAGVILSAYATAGAVTGAKTPVVGAPATTEVAIDDNGDILFNAATDMVTAAEVTYIKLGGPIIEDAVVTVTSDVATLLAGRGAQLLLEAEILTGTATGTMTIVARDATPIAGQAALQIDGLGVEFAAADAATSVRVKYIATPGVGTVAASPSTLAQSEVSF